MTGRPQRGSFFRRLGVLALLALAPFSRADPLVHTDPLNRDPRVREAYQHFYTLDYDGAVSRFERIEADHPGNPLATTYVLNSVLFRELYRLDLLDTTFYANDGFLTGRHSVEQDPQVRARVRDLADRAVAEANQQLKANSNDANALFARGWARSLSATYMAMVQRSFGGGLRMAMQARSDHERLLQLDPQYVDAKMVVGIYQYVVGALPLAFKFLVGFAGITGSKTKGLEMLEDSARRGVITTVESRTALTLFYRREARYKKALEVAQSLSAQYPHNFLFVLEEANLAKDDGEGMTAVEAYRKLLELAARPGYFPSVKPELAWYGLGDSLRGQTRYLQSAQAYEHAASQPGTAVELKRRSLLAAGQCYDLANRRNDAVQRYRSVLDAGEDSTQADTARKYLKSAYTGR